MDAEKDRKELANLHITIETHVNGSGSKILAGENHGGNLRAADRSAFQKFNIAANRIIVTKEVLDMLHGASHNLRTAQKQYEGRTLLPSQNPSGQAAAASLQPQPQTISPRQPCSPKAQITAAPMGGQIRPGGVQFQAAAGDFDCPPDMKRVGKRTQKTEKPDWGHFRMMGACRVAPSAAAAVRFSPEASPRPYQPGLSVDAATRESWDTWELMTEEEALKAEVGWRDLLKEKRAKMRGRSTEQEIRHAAARMIQATWRLHHHRLVQRATAELDERLSRASTMRSGRHARSGSVSPLSNLSRQGSGNISKDMRYVWERPQNVPAAARAAQAAAAAASEAASAADDGNWEVAIIATAAAAAAAAAAQSAAAAAASCTDSPLKERQRKSNTGAYEVKPRAKPAARPQPMSVAVGRDGLAIETAMPKAKKRGIPNWKAAAQTAMACSGLGSSQDESKGSHNGSVDGYAADARSRSVSQVGAAAESSRSNTESAGTAAGHVRSRRSSADSMAAAQVRPLSTSKDDKAAAAEHGSAILPVTAADTAESAPALTAAAADMANVNSVCDTLDLGTIASKTSPVLSRHPGGSGPCVALSVSGQTAAQPNVTDDQTLTSAQLQQQLTAWQSERQPHQHQQHQEQQSQEQIGVAAVIVQQQQQQPLPTSSGADSRAPANNKFTKVQIIIQRKLDSLIPELALQRAVWQNPAAAGAGASDNYVSRAHVEVVQVAAAGAVLQQNNTLPAVGPDIASALAAPAATQTVEHAGAVTAVQQHTAAAADSTSGSLGARLPPAAAAVEAPAAAALQQDSAAARGHTLATVAATAELLAAAAKSTAEAVGQQHCAAVLQDYTVTAGGAQTCTCVGTHSKYTTTSSTGYDENRNDHVADESQQLDESEPLVHSTIQQLPSALAEACRQAAGQQQRQSQQAQVEVCGEQQTQLGSRSSSFCSCDKDLCDTGQEQPASSALAAAITEHVTSSTAQSVAASDLQSADRTQRHSESWLASMSLAGGVPAARALGEAVISFAGGIVAAAAAASTSSSSSISSNAAGGGSYRGSSLIGGWFASKTAQTGMVGSHLQLESEDTAVLWPIPSNNDVQQQQQPPLQLQPCCQQQEDLQQEPQEPDLLWMQLQSQHHMMPEAPHKFMLESQLASVSFTDTGHGLAAGQPHAAAELGVLLDNQHQSEKLQLQLNAAMGSECSEVALPGNQQQWQQLPLGSVRQPHKQQLHLDDLSRLAEEAPQGSAKQPWPRQQQQQQQQQEQPPPSEKAATQLHKQQLSLDGLPQVAAESSQGSPKQLSPKQQRSPRSYALLQPSIGPQGLEFLPIEQQQSPSASHIATPRGSDSNAISPGGSAFKPQPPKDGAQSVGQSPRMMIISKPPPQSPAGLKALVPPTPCAAAAMASGTGSGSSTALQLSIGSAENDVRRSAAIGSNGIARPVSAAPRRVGQLSGLKDLVPPTATEHINRSSRHRAEETSSVHLASGAPVAAREGPGGRARSPQLPKSKTPGLKGIIPPSASSAAVAEDATAAAAAAPAPALAALSIEGMQGYVIVQHEQQQQGMDGGSSSSNATVPVLSTKGSGALPSCMCPSPPGSARLGPVAAHAASAGTTVDQSSSRSSSTGLGAAANAVLQDPRSAGAVHCNATAMAPEELWGTVAQGKGLGLSPRVARGMLVSPRTPNTASEDVTTSSAAVTAAVAKTAAAALHQAASGTAGSAGSSPRVARAMPVPPGPPSAASEGAGQLSAVRAEWTAVDVALEAEVASAASTRVDGAMKAAAVVKAAASSGHTCETLAIETGVAETSAEAAPVKKKSGSTAGPQLSSLGQKLAVARRISQNVAGTAVAAAQQLDGSSTRGLLAGPPAAAAAAGATVVGESITTLAGSNPSTHSSSSGSGGMQVLLDLVRVDYSPDAETGAVADARNEAESGSGMARLSSNQMVKSQQTPGAAKSSAPAMACELYGCEMPSAHGRVSQPAGLQHPVATAAGEAATQQNQALAGDFIIPVKQRISSTDSLLHLEQQQQQQGRLAGRLSNLGTASSIAVRGPSPVKGPPAVPATAGRLSPPAPAVAAAARAISNRSRSPVAGQMPWQRPVSSLTYSGSNNASGSANVSRSSSLMFGIPVAAAVGGPVSSALGMVDGQRRTSIQDRAASDPRFDVITSLKGASFIAAPASTGAAAGSAARCGLAMSVEVGKGAWGQAPVAPQLGCSTGAGLSVVGSQARQNGAGVLHARQTEAVGNSRSTTPPLAVGAFAAGLLPALTSTRRNTAM